MASVVHVGLGAAAGGVVLCASMLLGGGWSWGAASFDDVDGWASASASASMSEDGLDIDAGEAVDGVSISASESRNEWLVDVDETAGSGDQSLVVVLAARRRVALSAATSGFVQSVAVELGESFEAGQVLVGIESSAQAAELAAARANAALARQELARVERLRDAETAVVRARAVEAAAVSEMEAAERLHADGHGSLVELGRARRDAVTARTQRIEAEAMQDVMLAQARATLAAAEARVVEAERVLDACRVAAPFTGRVEAMSVEASEWVERGRVLARVVDDRVLRARMLAPAHLVGRVSVGQVVKIRIVELDEVVAARVSHIAAVLDAPSATVEIMAEIANDDGRLRVGMNGYVVEASFWSADGSGAERGGGL